MVQVHSSVFVSARLAIYYLLRGRMDGFLVILAIKCSSFTQINRGTSKRSACCSMGYEPHLSVQEANQLLERLPKFTKAFVGPGFT